VTSRFTASSGCGSSTRRLSARARAVHRQRHLHDCGESGRRHRSRRETVTPDRVKSWQPVVGHLVATSVIPVLPSGCGRPRLEARPARRCRAHPGRKSPRARSIRRSPAPSSVWMPERLESSSSERRRPPVLHRGSRNRAPAKTTRRSAGITTIGNKSGRSAVNRVQRRRRRASEFVTGHFRRSSIYSPRPAHPPHFLHRALTVCELLTMSCPQCTRRSTSD